MKWRIPINDWQAGRLFNYAYFTTHGNPATYFHIRSVVGKLVLFDFSVEPMRNGLCSVTLVLFRRGFSVYITPNTQRMG